MSIGNSLPYKKKKCKSNTINLCKYTCLCIHIYK